MPTPAPLPTTPAATITRPPQIPAVPADMPSIRTLLVRFAQAINSILRGGIGCTLQITLVPNSSSSAFNDSRIGPFTYIGLTAITADAENVLQRGYWIETGQGTATIHHASSGAAADLTCVACLIG